MDIFTVVPVICFGYQVCSNMLVLMFSTNLLTEVVSMYPHCCSDRLSVSRITVCTSF